MTVHEAVLIDPTAPLPTQAGELIFRQTTATFAQTQAPQPAGEFDPGPLAEPPTLGLALVGVATIALFRTATRQLSAASAMAPAKSRTAPTRRAA